MRTFIKYLFYWVCFWVVAIPVYLVLSFLGISKFWTVVIGVGMVLGWKYYKNWKKNQFKSPKKR